MAGSPPEAGPRTPRALFARYRGRLLLTYSLFNLENVLSALAPLVLGWAINDLIAGVWTGVVLLAIQHITHVTLSSLRRAYDTRVFSSIYTDLAGDVVVSGRTAGIEVSALSARSALSRELVDFFEVNIPTIVASLYAVGGALVMLMLFDPLIAAVCLGLLLPLGLIQRRAWPVIEDLNAKINDRYEREVAMIERATPRKARGHYGLLARWRIRLSDLEMRNFATMEAFVLVVIVVALVRFCGMPGATPGAIFSVLMYVLTFVAGLDAVPLVVQQVSRMRDISKRIAGEWVVAGG